jgi:alpha/beta superfamily hydrolase
VTPFFFGASDRRLYGTYDPAATARSSGASRAAVICAPWGPDYVFMHGVLRRLAFSLSDAGVHVLRFDYFGVGDSAGEGEEASIVGWREDIAEAIEELKSMAGVQRIDLVGVRLGATMAAEVAVKRTDINSLVLWDPVVSGAEYVADLDAAHAEFIAARTRYTPLPPTDKSHRVCYPFPASLEAQMRALDLTALAPRLRPKTLLILSESLASHGVLLERLKAAGDRTKIEHVSGAAPWRQLAVGWDGVMPTEALAEIEAWLA